MTPLWLPSARSRAVRPNRVLRPVGVKGFVVVPRRWVVERTFAWLGRYRRLSKDYERLPETSETLISIARIHRMSRELLREPTS